MLHCHYTTTLAGKLCSRLTCDAPQRLACVHGHLPTHLAVVHYFCAAGRPAVVVRRQKFSERRLIFSEMRHAWPWRLSLRFQFQQGDRARTLRFLLYAARNLHHQEVLAMRHMHKILFLQVSIMRMKIHRCFFHVMSSDLAFWPIKLFAGIQCYSVVSSATLMHLLSRT